MINYDIGEITDLLPASIKYNEDVIAISYALKMAKERLLLYCERIKLWSNIDQLPEEVIDLMALELNAHYYSQEMGLEKKREIVKAALGWYINAGTVEAVEEMMRIIFGNGGTEEWYNFSDGPGKPGTFDIFTDATLTPDLLEQLTIILRRVKKASAHLRRIRIERKYYSSVRFGSAAVSKIKNTIQSANEEVNRMETQALFLTAAARRIRNHI